MPSKAPPLRQEEPTPLKRHPYDWEKVAKRCRRTPGEWFKVFEKDRRSLQVAISQQKVKALLERDGFTTTTRNNSPRNSSPRTCSLYVMYDPALDQSNQRKKEGDK